MWTTVTADYIHNHTTQSGSDKHVGKVQSRPKLTYTDYIPGLSQIHHVDTEYYPET